MPAIHYHPRYSVDDYRGWKGDWELWDGSPVAMSPSPSFAHGAACAALAAILRNQMKGDEACSDCSVAVEIDWIVGEHDVVRPDLSVVCGKPPEMHIEHAPRLVAEFLSPSTREKDLNAKKALYAKEGVAFYVIGDPDTKELNILRLTDGHYLETDEPNVVLHHHCEVTIDPLEVFN